MTADTMPIQVPRALYQRLERLVHLTNRPLDTLVAQALSASLPPLPDDLPPAMRDALLALEPLSDAELEQVADSTMPDEQAARLADLREQRRAGRITAVEQHLLDALLQEADLLTLRKAYAAVLLKWRGHALPSLAELESPR